LTVSSTYVTSLASDGGVSETVIAGCGDGSLRVFDLRTKIGNVNILKEHKNPIVKVHVPLFDTNKIVSGSLSGTIKIWDVKSTSSDKTFRNPVKDTLVSLLVHSYAPVIVSAYEKSKMRFLDFDGNELNMIRPDHRIGLPSSLAFHPYFMTLGVGTTENIIALFKRETK